MQLPYEYTQYGGVPGVLLEGDHVLVAAGGLRRAPRVHGAARDLCVQASLVGVQAEGRQHRLLQLLALKGLVDSSDGVDHDDDGAHLDPLLLERGTQFVKPNEWDGHVMSHHLEVD